MPTVEERNIGRGGSGVRKSRLYTIRGAATEDDARDALIDAAPSTLGGLPLASTECEVEEITTGDMWIGTAVWSPQEYQQVSQPVGNFQLSFDISGQTTRITQSKETVLSFPVNNHANFGGAINVQADGTVEGTDILVPYFTYTLTRSFAQADIDQNYVLALAGIVGTVNDATFQGFPSGELLLTRVSGSQRGGEDSDWDITFSFAVSRNATDVSIGPTIYPSVTFVLPSKRGWDFLWVHYGDYKDTGNNVVHKRPKYAYVERVYDYTNYNALNI